MVLKRNSLYSRDWTCRGISFRYIRNPLALKAVGVGTGDIVFCPSLTFSATANPIIYQNAIPVFVDSDIETWNMST